MKKILTTIIMLALLGSLFAAKFETQGNTAANEGDTLFKSKKYAEALTKYESALSNYTKAYKAKEIASNEKINKMISNSYVAANKAKNYEKVVFYLQKMIDNEKKASKKRKLYTALAQIYDKRLNNTAKAIDVLVNYNNSLKKPDVRVVRKIAYYYGEKKLNQPQKALEWLNKAYKIKADANVIQKIASLHIGLNQNSEAIAAYTNYLKTNPNKKSKIRTYKNMGALYNKIKQDTKAIEYFEKYLALKYDEKIAVLILQKHIDAKNDALAKKMAERMLKKNSKQAFAIYTMGDLAFKAKKMDEAKKWFEKVKSNPTYGKNAKAFLKQLK